jgi:hypothetical protein
VTVSDKKGPGPSFRRWAYATRDASLR